MMTMSDWHNIIASESHLPPDAARQLRESGFVVMPGPIIPGGCEQLWSDAGKYRDKSLQCHWNTPIHVGGYLYACSGRHTPQAELRCVELATGKVMWAEKGLSRASLTLIDGHFLCLTERGELLLLKVNPQKYEEVARMDLGRDGSGLLPYPCWAAPVLSRGRLYLRSEHRLVCLELIPARR